MPEYASNYPNSLQYPVASDPVNVHGDFKVLVDALNSILPPLGYGAAYLDVRNTTGLTTMGADLFSATINKIIMTQLMAEKFLTFLEEGTQFTVFGDQEAEEK